MSLFTVIMSFFRSSLLWSCLRKLCLYVLSVSCSVFVGVLCFVCVLYCAFKFRVNRLERRCECRCLHAFVNLRSVCLNSFALLFVCLSVCFFVCLLVCLFGLFAWLFVCLPQVWTSGFACGPSDIRQLLCLFVCLSD